MVLEDLISSRKARQQPVLVFFLAFAVSSVSIWLSYHVFPTSSSILPLAFLTTAFVPLIHKLYIQEAIHEVEAPGWAPSFLTRHFSLVWFYTFLFLGIVASYAFWFVVLPADNAACGVAEGFDCFFPTKDRVFFEQANVFSAITGKTITGKAIGEKECKNTQTRSLENCFSLIFFNNFWVLNLAIILSFLYGAGGVFLMGWNASVIGTFIGIEILSKNIGAGIDRLFSYFPHGSFEVLAYFFGAIAGGVISAAMLPKHHLQHAVEIIAKDALILVLIANVFLFIGALIEAASIIDQNLANQMLSIEILVLIGVAIFLFFKKK